MRLYEMAIVTQVLTIEAASEEEAEAKYDAYFGGDACPCGADDCDCVKDSEDTYHITTDLGERE